MVQDEVLSKVRNKKLAVFVVWARVLPDDSEQTATEAAKLITDKRAKQFYDGAWASGLPFARTVTLPMKHKRAWDIYFAYDAGLTWGEIPPKPTFWAHQLGYDERCLGDGKGLREAVARLR